MKKRCINQTKLSLMNIVSLLNFFLAASLNELNENL